MSNALCSYYSGLDEGAQGIWSIYLGEIFLAQFDERDMIIIQ